MAKRYELTDDDRKSLKDAGADYARDWLSWNKDSDEKLDGQSEAFDLADGFLSDKNWPQRMKDVCADYVYEGMQEVLESNKKVAK